MPDRREGPGAPVGSPTPPGIGMSERGQRHGRSLCDQISWVRECAGVAWVGVSEEGAGRGAVEFQEVVDRRRMVRAYTDESVDEAVVDRILRNAVRAPNAGFSQGWGFLVLDTPEAIDRFWNCWSDESGASADPKRAAPLVIVALSCMQVYLEVYAEPEKGEVEMDPSTWEAPYWDIDTGMASLLMLLTVVDEGL